jgi:tetratricopeptide (TPR) repeat protein
MKPSSNAPCGPSALQHVKTALQQGATTAWTSEFLEEDKENDNIQGEGECSLDENWVEELKAQETGWVEEFEQKASLEDQQPDNWAEEYQRTDDPWVAEFKTRNADLFSTYPEAEEDPQKLAESAAALLATLDAEHDEKLANSQFVAYLRRLANGEAADVVPRSVLDQQQAAFEDWREEFRRSVDGLVSPEDRVWEENWIKDWQQYSAEGIGYGGFAAREFRKYQFSPNSPFADQLEEELRRQLDTETSLRDRILLTEALLQIHPTAPLWSSLGRLQSDNEMDVQAIAAHQEALSMDRTLSASWLGLALACINERCIPDAYEAMSNWLASRPAFRQQRPMDVQAPNRNSELLRCFLSLPDGQFDPEVLLLTSILQVLDGQHSAALNTLRSALGVACPGLQPPLRNRLGAMLANSGHYDEALREYQSVLASLATPRLHYNVGISLMSLGRHGEAQQALVRALQLQLPVTVTSSLRPDLRDSYRSIWVTLTLICELQGNDHLRMQSVLGNLGAFLP